MYATLPCLCAFYSTFDIRFGVFVSSNDLAFLLLCPIQRFKAYEDVESVAADLIARKITCPDKLAVIGGSNGGMMVGNMITRPVASKLFGAAVCQVPLLDMKRYSQLLAGASWMGEYGNPDIPAEWVRDVG
jgi:prolyl oligopeptidase PreP (S9A serine peptidase family)